MTLAPIWREIGDRFKDSEDVAIAKIDGFMNEFEDFEITDVPTIKLFPKVRLYLKTSGRGDWKIFS